MISFYARLKIVIFSFALFTLRFAAAQTRYNLFAGVHAVATDYRIRGLEQPTSTKPGFLLGVGAKIEFENRLFFSPALSYALKGYKVTLNQAAYPPNLQAIKNNTTIHSLEIAVLLQYDFTKQPSHFFIKAGPVFDIQLLGREKTLLIDGNTIKKKMKYGYADYGRYAGAASLLFGYEFSNNYFGQVFYTHGLTDLNNADDGPSIKYRIFGLTIGKYLGKK